MAILSPKRWTRQPQYRVGVDPKWVAAGLNLALVPFNNAMVDYSANGVRGSGGVQTNSSCPQGRTILRTSGNYAFRGLLQSGNRFSIVAVIRQAATAENVVSISASATTTGAAQFTTQSGEINLTLANTGVMGTSSGAALANGKTSIIGLTYDGANVIFYCDGRQLNTVASVETFVQDGSGILFVKQNGANPFTGGLALHLDFKQVLSPSQMVALTGNPWQIFLSKPDFILEVPSGGATSHDATGALIGGGSVIAGSASSFTPHNATGILIGGGSVIAGVASSATTRTASGALIGGGSVVVGTAARTRQHDATGILVGGGSVVNGVAERTGSPVIHDATGVLVGGGSVINGTATLTPVTPPTPVNPNLGGGGSGYDPKQQIKANKSIRRLLEKAYNKIEPEEVQVELKEAVIAEAIQEIQEQVVEDLSAVYMIQLIQQIEQRMIKQRNDELAAIILLLD